MSTRQDAGSPIIRQTIPKEYFSTLPDVGPRLWGVNSTMPTIEDTIKLVVEAKTWDERVSRIRQIPGRHGTDEHAAIHAAIAKVLYVPHLAPDFAYVHSAPFYEFPHFQLAYDKAVLTTAGFTKVSI